MKIELITQRAGSIRQLVVDIPSDANIQYVLNRLHEFIDESWESLVQRGYGFAVYGKKKSQDYTFCDGDRLEICGPLIATPMDARRRRAKKEHKGGKM